MREISNDNIANVLDQISDLLEAKDANPHRVRAYRDGAASVRNSDDKIADWVQEGQLHKLKEIPGIGSGIAA